MTDDSATDLELGLAAARRVAGRWFVEGELREASASYELHAPTLPESGLTVADVSAAEAVTALEGCAAAQEAWGSTLLGDRVAIVRKIGEALDRRRQELEQLIVLESGKTLRFARFEVQYALQIIEAMCAASQSLAGASANDYVSGRAIAVTHRPIGPSLLVTPWNFPLSLGLRKVVTALLAGCTLVLKPSDRTPLTSVVIGEALAEAGVPIGVAAVVPTSDSIGVVDALLGHPALKKLSFTGSTHVGKALHRRASDQLVRTSLELGGNAPFIFGQNATVENALPAIMAAKFGNSGQACTALNRLLVPRSRRAEIVDALSKAIDGLVVGDPRDAVTDVGPLVTVAAAQSVRDLVARAAQAGADIREKAGSAVQTAYLVNPVIVSNVKPDSEIFQSEIFGPVITVVDYDDLDDAIALANSTPYGLAAYVASDDFREIESLVPRIQAGMIAVNSGSVSAASSPFGGIGWSGHGRENGSWGLNEFTETIAVLR